MKVCALLVVGGVFALIAGWAVARVLERIVSALERSKRLPALAMALVLAPALLMLAACAHTAGAEHATHGVASWYDEDSHTATGARYNPEGMTAAHRTLPFGTMVRVTNLHNGYSVIVRVSDRGPFVKGRVIDLSRAAARAIGMLESGVIPVLIEIVR